MQCNVCNVRLEQLLYATEAARSLTSLATFHEGKTHVYFCHQCGHVQSAEIENIAGFYDHEYDILVASEEEDQLYEVVDGENIYRTEHQMRTLLEKVDLRPGAKVMDYGCAKSATLRALLEFGVAIDPYAYDVSDRYIPFWEKFLPPEQWATYAFPQCWDQHFDLVTSFFSLEHMSQPQLALRNMHRALQPHGKIYGIVPNICSNTADLIVVDHVNHFTASSLHTLLQTQGFDVLDIDVTSHRGAFVFLAEKKNEPDFSKTIPALSQVQEIYLKAQSIAAFWVDAAARVRAFEATLSPTKKLAIYGAGFYGAFLASSLQQAERVICVVDKNPFLQGKKLNQIEIGAPASLPKEVDTLLVGLNPIYAKEQIAKVAEFHARSLTYFFL